jgi:hypothetical protein
MPARTKPRDLMADALTPSRMPRSKLTCCAADGLRVVPCRHTGYVSSRPLEPIGSVVSRAIVAPTARNVDRRRLLNLSGRRRLGGRVPVHFLGYALVIAIGLSACGSQAPLTSATPTTTNALISVALSGSLSGSFVSCRSSDDHGVSGTVLRGTVVDDSGEEVGTAEFLVLHVGTLIPGTYLLSTGVGRPTGSRAVGTLTVTPLAGRELPAVTVGQRYGRSSLAVFLTQTGTLAVGTDGAATIRTDLIDFEATRQTPDHPVISGTWHCAS